MSGERRVGPAAPCCETHSASRSAIPADPSCPLLPATRLAAPVMCSFPVREAGFIRPVPAVVYLVVPVGGLRADATVTAWIGSKSDTTIKPRAACVTASYRNKP